METIVIEGLAGMAAAAERLAEVLAARFAEPVVDQVVDQAVDQTVDSAVDRVIGSVVGMGVRRVRRVRVVAFYGQMGAGKTTLIKALCSRLGVEQDGQQVNSPSFAIVNEYRTAQAWPIYHFDFYRIRSVEEAFDFGYEEYFYGGALCLVEWPEQVEELLPEETIRIRLDVVDENTRILKAC